MEFSNPNTFGTDSEQQQQQQQQHNQFLLDAHQQRQQQLHHQQQQHQHLQQPESRPSYIAPSATVEQSGQSQHDSFINLTTASSAPPPGSTNPAPAIQHPPPQSQQAQQSQQPEQSQPQQTTELQFDIFEWYPKYQSCQRYFTTHAQSSPHVQAVAAFVNIHLPFQRSAHSLPPSSPHHTATNSSIFPPASAGPPLSPSSVSLIPYLRRLVITGLDFPGVLHGFFGDDWTVGVGPLHEQERRNYLFAAKSGGWASVKKDYDMLPLETVPFMRPLQGPVIAEIEAAEKSWSEWLAMEDWMVGPRAPENLRQEQGGPVAAEQSTREAGGR